MASIVCLLMAVCPEIPSSVSDSSEASLLTELSVTRSERFMGAAGGTGAAELRLMSLNQEGEGEITILTLIWAVICVTSRW